MRNSDCKKYGDLAILPGKKPVTNMASLISQLIHYMYPFRVIQ